MADRIKLLPDSVANQIAAGEVVNRPSSTVKEMMENAVDAGASNITVNFKDGGKALIQVVDDGVGMSANDARLAFDRHATSKIDKVEDIYRLGTFGFRGEALASIASVAEVELRTRQKGSELGTSVCIHGGKFVSQTNIHCPEGSQFLVRNLFYNVPARRRFLEKSSTETRHILAEYNRVALCNPDIGFALYDNDVQVSRLEPSSLRQRVIGIAGKNIGRNLLEVTADTSIVKIEGFTGSPSSAKQTNKEQFLFVNGRYFKSPYFHKAVISGYEKLIPSNTQPSYFIYLTVDTERIDVNVHPQKTEIKFEDGAEIWSIINAAVRESLAKSGAVPSMDFEMDTSIQIPVFNDKTNFRAPRITGNSDFNPFADYSASTDSGAGRHIFDFLKEYKSSGEGAVLPAENDIPDYGEYENSLLDFITDGKSPAISGALFEQEAVTAPSVRFGDYAVTVRSKKMIVVHLRRAYETVLYNRFTHMSVNGGSLCQQLLFPEKVTMSNDDRLLLDSSIGELTSFGFDIRREDEFSVMVYGVPADFTEVPAKQLIFDLLDTVKDEECADSDIRASRLSAMMARIGALGNRPEFRDVEIDALVTELFSSENFSFTPSGKKVIFTISEDQLKKSFD